MILSMVGLAVLVAVVVVGAYWLITNVSFKSVKKEDENE
jgi:heme/copper-type cytochrome/quinol oxidase subunit 4